MTIIRPTTTQLPTLVRLFEAYRAFYRQEPDPVQAIHFLKERMDHTDSVIFLALDEAGEGVGFVQLYPLFSSTRMRKLWLLNDLYVVPEHRGKDIARKLIERSKSLAIETQAAGLLLETEKSNAIGNQLYPATGFTLDHNHYYYSWDCPVRTSVLSH